MSMRLQTLTSCLAIAFGLLLSACDNAAVEPLPARSEKHTTQAPLLPSDWPATKTQDGGRDFGAGLTVSGGEAGKDESGETKEAKEELKKPAKARPKITLAFPVASEFETVRFDGELTAFLTEGSERVELEAEIISGQSRPLEFLVVGFGGAVHEALLRIWAKASHLKSALELIGCREGERKISARGANEMPEGEEVTISLRWQDAAGETQYARIEDWVYNVRTKEAMARGPWIFSGGRSAFREDIQRDTYEPDWSGNIIATWRDPSCVVDNPRVYGVDSGAYSVNGDAGIPDSNTTVTMIFQRTNPPKR